MTSMYEASGGAPSNRRRMFLKWSGAAVAAALAAGLDLSDLSLGEAMAQAPGGPSIGPNGSVDLGSGDTGILNYAYALEQLEAAFYTQVVGTPYRGMRSNERQVLSDIRDHEIAHRSFFKQALGRNAIPDLRVDFSAVNFSSRESVLGTARTFEDLGVSAYNGGGAHIKNTSYLLLAGKIVSVEARHAAAIRDLISPYSTAFADDEVVDAEGLDRSNPPSKVLAAAAPFIRTRVTAHQLP